MGKNENKNLMKKYEDSSRKEKQAEPIENTEMKREKFYKINK